MTTESKTKLRSTLSAIIAVLVMFGPDILDALTITDGAPKWVKLVAKGAGLLIGLATSGKAVAILNKFLPADPVPAPKPEVIDISTPKPAA